MARKIHFILFFLAASISVWGQSSVLSSGNWYKFSVPDDGIYKIDYSLLQKAGIDPSQVNPKNIKIFTGQPGMLPQANSAARMIDLTEIPISVVGEADGKFDGQDYILFYGQGPDKYSYDSKSNFFSYEKNLYSDKNFYFLTISSPQGKRIIQSPNLPGSFPVITTFDGFAYYENDKYNQLHSGRQWFGEQFGETMQLTVLFNLPGIVPGSSIRLTSHVMAQSINDCSFNVSFNGAQLMTQPIAAVPNSAFALKGRIAADTLSINESTVDAASTSLQQIQYQFNRGSFGISIGYLDYLIFSTKRKLALYNNQTIFTSTESTSNPISTFQINAVAANGLIWEVTNPLHIKNQQTQSSGISLTYSTNTDSLKKFVVFSPSRIAQANFESKVANQNLHAINNADLLIISHKSLMAQATRLALHRQTNDQLTVETVTTDEVYNEYAGGKLDVTALRDFIRDVYIKSSGQLKYVLLFGRGSYDYKDRVYANTNLVPIYESYNSLDPLATYSSDDYFGFLENNEGLWPEDPAINYSMDVGVGRIPAKNLADAQAIVDKLIDYDTNSDRFGSWRKDFLFVADDGDNNVHESQADQLADNIELNHSEFNAQKLFLDQYKQITKPVGQTSPEATKALDLAIRKGKSIVNYTGHGSEKVWAQELMLTEDLVKSLSNSSKYPLFVTATCEFGRNDDPFIISSAELLILQKKGGAIGIVTTARPVYSNTNFQLNQAFYQALFNKTNNQFRRLGSIIRDTKNNSQNGTSNRNFSLLGDPSMKLALADNQVVVTEIETLNGSDTLKALSQVSVKGEIQNSGSVLTNFNGAAYATLFDKIEHLTTLGDAQEVVTPPSPPYNYITRSNKLFEGSISVTQGKFQFNFDIPNDLVPGINKGKISLYAYQNDGTEATGYSSNFSVGGIEPNPPVDTTPPTIDLFLSDSTFVNGGTVGPNTQLVAHLSDASGINIASAIPQNNIVATLDGKWSYTLNDYFLSKQNNFQKGTVIYPLDTLKKGAHTLSLSASDTHNNRAAATINFVVTDGSGINIGEFHNFPNPFNAGSETMFRFTHTRAGEDLDATINIYDFTGKSLITIDYSISNSTYQVDLGTWDGTVNGTKIGPGIYVARLFVRSLADGSQNERVVKLIILN